MQLKISQLRFRGIIVVSITRHRGVKLFFKNDPLESVSVSSTFDSLPSIRRYLQAEIETQLRRVFLDAIPTLVNKFTVDAMRRKDESRKSLPFHHADAPLDGSDFSTPIAGASVTHVDVSRLSSHASPSSPTETTTALIDRASMSVDHNVPKCEPPPLGPLLLRQYMSPDRNTLTAELCHMLTANFSISPFAEPTTDARHCAHRTDPRMFHETGKEEDFRAFASTHGASKQRYMGHVTRHDLDVYL